ncbi:MAG: Ldh family oxidoreductase [Anaerolineae bacterium]|jgi:LDH2 family malate/lactate/ureidoglycolate dehydrogenase|nr:Ldh family oxidoreductase [Chloroflexota bacterium]
MVHVSPSVLMGHVQGVLAAAGLPKDQAEVVAQSLVESDLAGHNSHGVLRVGAYVNAIERGAINPQAKPETVRSSATTALIDGNGAIGIVVAQQAMALAMEKANEHDLGMIAVRNLGHTGRMGAYTSYAASQGYVAMIIGAGSRPGGTVAPYGAASAVFNTDPMSWGLPAKVFPAVYTDFATSVAAWGKVQNAIDRGKPIPEGWILDSEGRPTTDPNDLRNGVLLPFGAHKGSGLAFVVEALTGGLSGSSCAPLPDYKPQYTLVMIAIRVEAFQPLDEFRARIDGLVNAVHSARPAEGFDRILVPGETEWLNRQQGLRVGLEISDAAWERIVAAGAKYGYTVSL